MPYVEFYKLNADGTQSVIATCGLTDQGVVCEGDAALTKNLHAQGIVDYASEDRASLFPKDGLKFLEQLKNNFKSGYLNASEVKEK